MRVLLLLVAYFLIAGLSLFVLAFLLYREEPDNPDLRFTAAVIGVLGVVSLAFALLLWMEIRFSEDTSAGSHLHLCGKLTRKLGSGTLPQSVEAPCAAALTATRLAPCGAGRLCNTARHTEGRLRPARHRAWESWC